jgi:hypothetical protein
MKEYTKKRLKRLGVNTKHILPVYASYIQGASIKILQEFDQCFHQFFMSDRPKAAIQGLRK